VAFYEIEVLEEVLVNGQPSNSVTVEAANFEEADRLVRDMYPEVTVKVVSRVKPHDHEG
jgi:hypothetical protein